MRKGISGNWINCAKICSFANLMPCVTVSLIINETKQYYDIGNQAYIEFTNVYAYFYIAFSYFVRFFTARCFSHFQLLVFKLHVRSFGTMFDDRNIDEYIWRIFKVVCWKQLHTGDNWTMLLWICSRWSAASPSR